MTGIASLLAVLGLDGSWLPILVGLVIIPVLYIVLAIDAHKDYGDALSKVTTPTDPIATCKRAVLRKVVDDALTVFDLEWWIVAAFGILVAAIIGSGYLTDWSQTLRPAPIGTVAAQQKTPSKAGLYLCNKGTGGAISCAALDEGTSASVRAAMSLYATLIGLLMGFRLGWARLRLAQDLKRYYLPPK
jgi:hypothetical protein